MTVAPCETRLEVLPEWSDQNGHMNVAYYVLAFDRATDTLYDRLGIGLSYLERERRSLFTLAMNIDYVGEVFAGDRLRIVSRLIDHDHKRIHYFHEMQHEAKSYVAATNELLAMHVSMAKRKGEPFPADVRKRLAEMRAAHAASPLPPQIGRKLGIRRS
jgi:acyl-CoA thioester hydrolase